MKNIHFLILAGGNGQRLWPLSTKNNPKHLIPFIGKKSLLQQTIDRIIPLTSTHKNIWVITNKDQIYKVMDQVEDDINVVTEQATRNTAPAILFTCKRIQEIDNNAIIVILPADHFIPDQKHFLFELNNILEWIQVCNKIATVGIQPTFPATGYGYIQAGDLISKGIYKAEKFHEKPNLENATKYISQYVLQKNIFWNGGIFIGKLNTFLREFETNAPELSLDMQLFFEKKIKYADLENISVDYAIMEKSKNIVVAPTTFEWSDVGNLSIFLSLQQKYQVNNTEIINFGGQNNIINSNKKLVVCIGVSELCIVETNDVILISRKQDVENIKSALPQVQKIYQNAL